MTIRLHDTLSGETRPLEPLEPGHVRIYSCGPTVYGPAHIGNFRSFLFADVLVRHMRWRGRRVKWVMNITDIDDQIVALISTLLERDHAYRTEDGSIFFRISSWPAYGQLSRLDPEGLRVGER